MTTSPSIAQDQLDLLCLSVVKELALISEEVHQLSDADLSEGDDAQTTLIAREQTLQHVFFEVRRLRNVIETQSP